MDENEQIVEKNITLGSADFEAHKKHIGRDDAPSDELDIERNKPGAADDGDDDFEAHKLKVDRPTVQRPSLQ